MVWVPLDSPEKKVGTQGPLYSSSLAGAAGASSALAESAAVSRSALDQQQQLVVAPVEEKVGSWTSICYKVL